MTQSLRKCTIGRASTCDVVLADESVSRIHAELTFFEDGKLLVTDCRSTQGTALIHLGAEARAIKQELVSTRDTLRFGKVQMSVTDVLRAIRLKDRPVAAKTMSGVGLVRCECGSVKIKKNPCEVCGK